MISKFKEYEKTLISTRYIYSEDIPNVTDEKLNKSYIISQNENLTNLVLACNDILFEGTDLSSNEIVVEDIMRELLLTLYLFISEKIFNAFESMAQMDNKFFSVYMDCIYKLNEAYETIIKLPNYSMFDKETAKYMLYWELMKYERMWKNISYNITHMITKLYYYKICECDKYKYTLVLNVILGFMNVSYLIYKKKSLELYNLLF